MKSKKPLLILSGLLALGLSAVAFAGPGHGFRRFGGPPMMRLLHLAERLDLTEEQEVKAVRMRRAIRKEVKANRQQMRASYDALLLELEKQNPDPAKLHRMVDDATKRINKVMHTSVDEYLEFHKTLSDEQRQTLVDEARDMRKHRKQRRERFGPGGR